MCRPEFDMPSHAGWVFGHPEITITDGSDKWNSLDPTINATYDFLRNFLSEMAEIFTDPYLHLGGDESNYIGAFAGDRSKLAWLAEHNLTEGKPHTTSWDRLWPYFWERLFSEVLTHGTLADKTINLWEAWDLSIFNGGVAVSQLPYDPSKTGVPGYGPTRRKVETPPDTVFNLYTSLNCVLNETAALGLPAVLSAPWYLDDTLLTHEYGDDSKGSVAMQRCHQSAATFGWINSIWKCFYNIFPDDDVPADVAANTSLVMGGEACIWGCVSRRFLFCYCSSNDSP